MNEDTLFDKARRILDSEQRKAYLDNACGKDNPIRQRVEELLRGDETSGPVQPSSSASEETIAFHASTGEDGQAAESTVGSDTLEAPAEFDPATRPQGLIANRYTLIQKVGEGGMGTVWVAQQWEPVKRKVAIKLIKPGMDSRGVLARFEQERQALAVMDHPNIARVLDGGLTPTGQPFFVMELVNGLPLTRFCDEAHLTPKQRLELFVPICQAVQHAHQKGIVHRDLKPANILITLVDAKPVPKIIDFGVAKATAGKLTDESLSTQFGAVVGTLEYMAPEQAGFSGEDIDTRADIYSLGVILYELLTGLRPIDASRLRQAAFTEMIRIIREEQPSKPSTRLSDENAAPSMAALRQTEPRKLSAMLRGDLDWIIMKCLEKPRDRRYATANALALDVTRYLAGDPVEAGPPSAWYRIKKLTRKHRRVVLASATFGLMLMVSTVVASGLAYWAIQQRDRARAAESLAQRNEQRVIERERLAVAAVERLARTVAENPRLRDTPELEELRNTLLRDPIELFQSIRDTLLAEKDTRPESVRRLADTSRELGRLTSEIGAKDDAIQVYREAIEYSSHLVTAEPKNEAARTELAETYGNLGRLLDETGRSEDALKAIHSARLIFTQLARERPKDSRVQLGLSHCLLNEAVLLAQAGQMGPALKAGQASLELAKLIAEPEASSTDVTIQRMKALGNIAIIRLRTGRLDLGLERLKEAIVLGESSKVGDEQDPEIRRLTGQMYLQLGIVQKLNSQPAQAMEALQKSLEVAQTLVKQRPSSTHHLCDLSRVHFNIGNVHEAQDQAAEALASYDLAREIQDDLVRRNPNVLEFLLEHAATCTNRGVVLSRLGRLDESLVAYKQAGESETRLVQLHPENPEFSLALASTQNGTGTLLYKMGRASQAARCFEKAIATLRTAIKVNPDHPTTRSSLVDYLSNLVQAYEAMGANERAAEVKKELLSLNPSS